MNGRSRPVGRLQTPAGKSTSEPTRTVGLTAAATPTVNLAAIPDSYYRAWVDGYGEGIRYGVARALDDIERAHDIAWGELSARVRGQASSPRYAKLCDLRGEPEKAERARERERGNGLDLL